MEQTKIELTALQRAKKKYYDKNKNTFEYKESKKKTSKNYYNKIKDDIEFKNKVSIQKKQYYLKKKELLKNMVEKSLDF